MLIEITKAIAFIGIGVTLMFCFQQNQLYKFQEVNQSCRDQGFDYGSIIGNDGICGYYISRKDR